ncbi:hypothetical protein EON82_12140 [bacterium]|nr:MAG: hypothetical protein EON82_12140 [bacterium]
MSELTLSVVQASPLAYLDGGTGSMLLQAALAGVLTAAYFFKGQWAMLKSRFQRVDNNQSSDK